MSVYDEVRGAPLYYVGFKDIGQPISILRELATRIRAAGAANDAEVAQHTLMAADIKRFLERSQEAAGIIAAAPAPPGAPIGDLGQDWLSSPIWCAFDESAPARSGTMNRPA